MSGAARKAFLEGVRDAATLLPGVAPFGLVFGTIAAASGLTPLLAHSSSYLIFAGSAQLITLSLIGLGAPAALIVLTAAVINLRHMLYSAGVAAGLQHLGPGWRALLSYLLTDESYAMCFQRMQSGGPFAHWHMLGVGVLMWVQWQISTLIGVFVGGVLPESWGLGFAVPVTFIALVFPSIKDRPMLIAALVSGFVAVLTAVLPYRTGILVAATAGIIAGVVSNRFAGAQPGAPRDTTLNR
jgi:predicted branched-subunit amino acid permease